MCFRLSFVFTNNSHSWTGCHLSLITPARVNPARSTQQADAAEQFKSQGVDLSNILQRPPPADDGSDEPHPALVSLTLETHTHTQAQAHT
jgi:hypothetical protein